MTTPIAEMQVARCRHCNRELVGKPHYMGGHAYDPETMERCPTNFYGGFVCSPHCDYQATLSLERSMPGHGYSQERLSIGSASYNRYRQNWPEES